MMSPPKIALVYSDRERPDTTASGYSPSDVLLGERSGLFWNLGIGWQSATSGHFPEWVEIDFASSQTLSEIDVFTLQDFYAAGLDPTPDLPFSLYGITAFDVQYWNGSAWTDVPGGSVTGNTQVWNTFRFSPLSTSKIRVQVNAALDNYARIVGVEAYSSAIAKVTTYTYDALDQLLAVNDPVSGRTTWTYDRAFNRLTQADPSGRTTYSYDAANQLQWVQAVNGYTTYSYDADGNTIGVVSAGGITTYLWDSTNRLSGVQVPSGQRFTQVYWYDDLRYERIGPSGTDTTLWDGNEVIYWSRSGGGPSELFVQGPPNLSGNAVGQLPPLFPEAGTQLGLGKRLSVSSSGAFGGQCHRCPKAVRTAARDDGT